MFGARRFSDGTLVNSHPVPDRRNIRTVWTIATEAFPEAHFATFPTALVEPCIKAGTSEKGCCAACGAGWRRVVERSGGPPNNRFRDGLAGDCKSAHDYGTVAGAALSRLYRDHGYPSIETVGWAPACDCGAETVPTTVLDPFAGAGTTLLVANRLGRRSIGIELSPAYCEMARRRIRDDAPLFAIPDENQGNGNGKAEPETLPLGLEIVTGKALTATALEE